MELVQLVVFEHEILMLDTSNNKLKYYTFSKLKIYYFNSHISSNLLNSAIGSFSNYNINFANKVKSQY